MRRQRLNVSRTLRSFDRGKGFYIGRHGSAILGQKLGSVAHDCSHGTADGIAVRQLAGLEDAPDVLLGIITYSGLGNIGNLAVAPFRVGAAGEAPACNDPAQAIARAVALRTMARTVDEIGAAIPLLRSGRIGLEVNRSLEPDAASA